MPHLRLEHTIEISANDTSDLFEKLVDILINNTTIQSSNCKSRAIKIKNYHMYIVICVKKNLWKWKNHYIALDPL